MGSLRSCSLPSTPLLKTLEKTQARVSFYSNSRFSIPYTTPRLFLSARFSRQMSSLKASLNEDNGASFAVAANDSRIGEVKRVTKETDVYVKINLDGTGVSECSTGIPFLDHMLDQLASHGLFDICVKASGDIHIDDHHTNEDVALAIGTALLHALGDRKGIQRFGNLTAPLDEAAVEVILLVEHFFQSLVNTSGMTLHIQQRAGRNSHHIIEATFKAFARALRQATEYDTRRRGSVPSYTAFLRGPGSEAITREELRAWRVSNRKVAARLKSLIDEKEQKGRLRDVCVYESN